MRESLINRESGITLVALVITIIILLILAGISIIQLTGSGLFDKAKLSKEKSENAKELENITLAEYENKIEETINNKDEDNRTEILEENPLVLDMSNNISDNGIASASHENGKYQAWCAFSSDETDAWSAWPNGAGSWIMYQFKEPVNISKIEFQAYDEYSVIENFTIYGSNDKVYFEEIYKGKHGLNDEIEEFRLGSYSKAYTFLKLCADSVYQNGGGVPAIKKLQYYGKIAQ